MEYSASLEDSVPLEEDRGLVRGVHNAVPAESKGGEFGLGAESTVLRSRAMG